MTKRSLLLVLLLAAPCWGAAPTVVITAEGTTQTRTAPCPVLLECVSGSTLGAGTWDQADVTWSVDASAGTMTHGNITDPVTGQTHYWEPSATQTGIHGNALGFVVENVAGTITVTCTVKQSDGLTGTDTLTISNTGTPDVTYALRGDAKYYRVGAGGNDSTPTGTGTAADPKYYRTFVAAVTAFSGNDNTVLMNKDETHDVEASPAFSTHHNTVVDAFAGGTVAPILASTAAGNIKIIGSAGADSSENLLVRHVTFRNNQAIAAAGTIAVSVVSDNIGIDTCTFEGDLGGNAFTRAIEATDGTDGLLIWNCTIGPTNTHAVPVGGVQTAFWCQGTSGASRGEHTSRWLTGGSRGCAYANIFCTSINHTGGTDSKGPIRLQTISYSSMIHCKLEGGQNDLGYDAAANTGCRVDGNLMTTGNGSAALALASAASNYTCCNNVLRLITVDAGFIKWDSSTANPETDTTNGRLYCNTILQEATSSSGEVAIQLGAAATDVYDCNYDVRNNLIAKESGFTGKQMTFHTANAVVMDAFDANIFPNVADAYVVAEVEDVDQSWTTFVGNSWESGTQREAIVPSELVAASYRPSTALAIAGATTPTGVHHDLYFQPRLATSYIGAVDLENAAPVATVTSECPTSAASGATVTLTGTGTDWEDGTLTGTSLAWSSNLDGALGTGVSLEVNDLSVGEHTITLTVTDSGSATDAATCVVTITAAGGFAGGAIRLGDTGAVQLGDEGVIQLGD